MSRQLSEFPARVEAPLGAQVRVSAWAPGYQEFAKYVTPTAAEPVVRLDVTLEESRPFSLFGFAKSELPADSDFIATAVRKEAPSAPLILIAWPRGNEFIIDRRGLVYRSRKVDGDAVESRRVGRVHRRALERATALLQRHEESPLQERRPGCYDCNFGYRLEYLPDGKTPILLASHGSRHRVRMGPIREAMAWILAVKRDAPWIPEWTQSPPAPARQAAPL
ncbi:MAG TPA: hypothetical protein VM686_21615 [Polyangiaceae bacterium]|jgi:hypothetical protein|nr:hypothetical protein [Polyangiaceae bacterium]